MPNCIAIKTDGEVCNRECREQRCAQHTRTLLINGPNTTALKELVYRHKAIYARIQELGRERAANEQDPVRRENVIRDLHFELNALKLQQDREFELLERAQQEEVRRTGVDPDAEANQRKREALQQRRHAQELRRAEVIARMREEEVQHQARIQAQILANIQNNRQNVQQRGELANFVNDNQNVHTTVAVNQTKEIVNRLLKIPVPEEYRWNTRVCSKTPGEIISKCNLTPKAVWQMTAKYCQDEDIYNMGPGIYGKVLDAVWQYTLQSPNKEDICRSLKQEMEDNIGMCAQGNLSRLCNILAGFMEGVGPQESPASIIGRKLPKVMEIEDLYERIKEAYKVLIEAGSPENEWDTWLNPLIENEDDVEYFKFNRVKDGNNNIIGLELQLFEEGPMFSLVPIELNV